MRLWVDTDLQPDDLIALRCARYEPGVELVGVSRTAEGIDADGLAAADVLLAIGPLTNVAALVGQVPFPSQVVVMGGALGPVDYRGRERSVEHNFAADPRAAATVLGAVRTCLVPLDVTADVRLPSDAETQLFAADPELRHAVKEWRDELRRAGAPEDQLGLGLHDPLALMVALDAVPVQTERMGVAIAEDGSVRRDPSARRHDVIRAIDAEFAIARIVTSFLDDRH